jgi:hypothetical protein
VIVDLEHITEEICEILCENAEQPAGRGCGYGITEDGQAEILAVIKRILPQTEKESIMKEQKIYHVTVAEKIEDLIETTGIIQGINRTVLFDGKVSAVTERSAEAKAKKHIKSEYDEDNLEVKVEAVNFSG